MSDTVAVIGCGIFGATIGARLARDGFQVTVFEKNTKPILGASLNNQNRLHLGYHYPRDLETAQSCIDGFYRFKKLYASAVREDFRNYYFIAEQGSRVDFSKYLEFCASLDQPYRVLEPGEVPEMRQVQGGIECEEVIYDSRILGELVQADLAATGAKLELGARVSQLTADAAGGYVLNVNGSARHFDKVINCTYADINRFDAGLGIDSLEHQYEYTCVPVVELDVDPIGLTVMDGPFWTLLPFGKTNTYLVYHVDHTVVEREFALTMPAGWNAEDQTVVSQTRATQVFNDCMTAITPFYAPMARARMKGFLPGPRMVLKGVDDTDKRPSIMNEVKPGYWTVFSGKVDHCTWVSEKIASQVAS